MSTFEIQPQFGGPSPKLKVDPSILGARLQLFLNEVVGGRNVIVDVAQRDIGSPRTEWRINLPPHEIEIYVAVDRILSYANAIYSEHVNRGSLPPREYTVNVWCRTKKQPAILGSFD